MLQCSAAQIVPLVYTDYTSATVHMHT